MRETVIVSTARTPIGKAFRGAFNVIHGVTLTGHVVEHAARRAGIDSAEVVAGLDRMRSTVAGRSASHDPGTSVTHN